MYVIGLTGGIGSGKSTVAQGFETLGVDIVDADIVAREVVMPGEPALEQIIDHFGEQLRAPDGNLDRSWLRQRVFDTPEERRWLESLLHPLIREQTVRQLQSARSEYCLLVSPLLLETDQHELADHILVVDVDEQTQIERTMARDSNSEQQIRAILKAQLSRQARLARADSVIDNSGEPEDLKADIRQLDKTFRQLAEQQRSTSKL